MILLNPFHQPVGWVMVAARECLRNPVGRINRVKTFCCESYFTYGCRNLLCLLFIVLIIIILNKYLEMYCSVIALIAVFLFFV